MAWLIGVAVGGCEPQEGRHSQEGRHWTVRDSAGVQVVENDPADGWAPPRWFLSEEPIVRIGQDESDPNGVWTHLWRTFWWSDGRIGIAVSDPPFLRIFSSDGLELTEIGSEGEGPGELTGVVWAGTLGDSAVIKGRSGLAIFDPAGNFVRRVRIGGECCQVIASTASEWIVKTREPYEDSHTDPPPPPQVTAEWVVIRVDGGGAVVDTLAQFEQVLTWNVQSSLWGQLNHVASDGRRVYEMDSRRFELRVYEDREITRIIRAPVPTIPAFTDDHLQAVYEEWGEIAERLIALDREAGRMIVPPAVALILNESNGDLWVRRTDDGPQAPVRQWDIFTGEGVWSATVETPQQLEISAVRGDQVLGVWTDGVGVTSARVYEVQ